MRMWLALAAVLFEIAASQSFLVVAEGFSAFRIGPLGSTGSTNPTNPTLTVAVGDNLTFLAQTASFHPFSIHTSPGSVGSAARYRSPDISGANPASLNATLVWTIVRGIFVEGRCSCISCSISQVCEHAYAAILSVREPHGHDWAN